MKLKPVVATMCVLGLGAAGTAFAASSTDAQIANLQAQIQQLQAQVNHMSMRSGSKSSQGMMSSMMGLVTLNQPVSQMINSDANDTGQTLALLNASTQGKIAQGLTLGGMMQGDLFWARSNTMITTGNTTESLFANPYLDAVNSTARNRTAITLTNVKINAVAHFNQWANGVLQVGDSYVGQSLNNVHTATLTFNNSNLTIQQAYLLVGNLSKSPFYGFVGKKYIDFGQFQNVNPFTQPLTREFFQANGNTAGVGMVAANFDVAVSVMNGGEHNDVIYSTNGVVAQNLYTRNKSMINNFAVNVGYGMKSDNGVNWHVGVGFLNGGGVGIAKADSNGLQNNQVVDFNARMSVNNMDFYAEYLTALSRAATYDGSTTAFKNGGRSQGWQLAGDYKFPLMGRNSVFGLSYSAVKAVNYGNGSYNQIAASLRQEAMKNIWVGVEYAYQDGVPFATVNGGDTVNHTSATNNTVTLDLTAYF